VNLLSEKSFQAPYGGRVERLLPNGVLVVRERPEEATEVATVNVAQALRVGPEAIRPYLRVEVGQPIDRGQWLAAVTGRVPPRFCPSPLRGTVKGIDTRQGLILISPLREQLEVKAWMPGRVVEVTERGCVLENEGVEITAIWGTGGEVAGPLVLDDPEPGCIIVRGFVTRDDLSVIAERGVAGLVCGGLHLQDVDRPFRFDRAFAIRNRIHPARECRRCHHARRQDGASCGRATPTRATAVARWRTGVRAR